MFVSPHALVGTLEDACAVLGGTRQCCLARELTKAHEELWRSSLSEALQEFCERQPRGEFTVVIQGREEQLNDGRQVSDEDILAALQEACASGVSPSKAAKSVAEALNVPRKRAYSLSLQLQE